MQSGDKEPRCGDKHLGFLLDCYESVHIDKALRTYNCAASLLELVLIRRFFCKDDHKVRDYFTFYLGIFSVFVFQANWQASNLFHPFLWLFCFIPEIKERRLKVRLHACTAVAAGEAGSLVSPIGIKGPLYLYYSLGTLWRFPQYRD